MGIDFLDLSFQIEKKCHLKLEKHAFEHFARAKEDHEFEVPGCLGMRVYRGDWRVGTFYELMRDHTLPICTKCRRTLPKQLVTVACPHCGMPCTYAPLTWNQFCESLVAVIGKSPGEIRRDHWLQGDLGFM